MRNSVKCIVKHPNIRYNFEVGGTYLTEDVSEFYNDTVYKVYDHEKSYIICSYVNFIKFFIPIHIWRKNIIEKLLV
jgi:hypothetical protein